MSELNTNLENQDTKKNSFRNSTTLKMLIVGFLILVLLIPLGFVQSLIREREKSRDDSVQQIYKDWGENIKFYGPILKIPYYKIIESTEKDVKTGKVTQILDKEIQYAYFFPNQLSIAGNIAAEPRKRGLYETSVFKAETNITGNFYQPDFQKLEIKEENVLWDKAQFIIQTTNVKGISEHLNMKIGEMSLDFASEFKNTTSSDDGTYYPKQEKKYLISTYTFNYKDLTTTTPVDFEIHFSANGSEKFEMVPIGKETLMHLTSNWVNPNFEGAYLPQNQDKVSKTGFNANWKILEMNRPFSQEFDYLPSLDEYACGVEFMIPVDNYQQNERSAKYGYLVIALTFLLFFLIQILSKINIHPFQYLLVGLALVIFYTLLLSITEHSDFTTAYLISGIATISLITLFSKSIMKTWKFPLFILTSLTALYTFIFVIIQLENYALLVGSIGLFAILAGVMYVSRKIDWNN